MTCTQTVLDREDALSKYPSLVTSVTSPGFE